MSIDSNEPQVDHKIDFSPSAEEEILDRIKNGIDLDENLRALAKLNDKQMIDLEVGLNEDKAKIQEDAKRSIDKIEKETELVVAQEELNKKAGLDKIIKESTTDIENINLAKEVEKKEKIEAIELGLKQEIQELMVDHASQMQDISQNRLELKADEQIKSSEAIAANYDDTSAAIEQVNDDLEVKTEDIQDQNSAELEDIKQKNDIEETQAQKLIAGLQLKPSACDDQVKMLEEKVSLLKDSLIKLDIKIEKVKAEKQILQ